MLLTILIFTLIGSVASLIGGLILLISQKRTLKISHLLISFAAGTLLGTAFFDLMPEALEEANGTNIFLWVISGILVFFILERFLQWFHHHNDDDHKGLEKAKRKQILSLIIIGDSIHNLLDGVVIAASFLVSVPLGIVTAFAVAAHEIPQEIGDFAIFLHNGVSRKKTIIINLLSAVVSIFGAVVTFYIRDSIQGLLPILLSITAGFFIYIASSDLIPEIHQHEGKKGLAFIETFLLILGAFLVYFLVGLLE